MTEAEISELAALLEGNPNAHLAWHQDDDGTFGLIVEFDNGKHFRGIMHPQAALEMFREDQ